MPSVSFRDRLLRRASEAGVAVSGETTRLLHAYYDLLTKWNARINLTGLQLDPPTDETFDRLLIEPLAAAPYIRAQPTRWFDLGSGGGSPALPLKIVWPAAELLMVESKARKCAFLSEAVRTLGLQRVQVFNLRFDELAARSPEPGQLVTVRAVRPDEALSKTAAQLLAPEGSLLLFRHGGKPVLMHRFRHVETHALVESRSAYLSIYAKMFHVEHN